MLLIEKIAANQFLVNLRLSFTSRLQLIQSVLFGIQVYWTGTFILPVNVIKDIEKLFNSYLWSGSDQVETKAKVNWDQICLPKAGGLGLKKIKDQLGSIWVAWVYKHPLRHRSFWDAKNPHDSSWGWRRILKLQDIARHIKWLIGKKIRVFLWSANWHPHGALAPKFGSRVIYNAASYPRAKVSSISGE